MSTRGTPYAAERGFSLIELLVSMAIGLVVTLAITVVMVNGERDKRSTTSVNDINQSGGYAAYVLDRQIRNAGSGFAQFGQQWSTAIGCKLKAQNGSGPVLSNTAAFDPSSPFAAWPMPIRLAPVLIGPGLAPNGGGDLLMVMAGTGGFIEAPQPVLPGVLAGSMKLANTYGFRKGDLVLLADSAIAAGCMVQQVGAFTGGAAMGGSDQTVNFESGSPAINYHTASIDNLDVTSFGASSYVAQIGNVNANLPQFSLFGVGDNSTLYANDLLPAGNLASGLQPIADGVVELRALYGMATSTTTSPITWTLPENPSTITAVTLRNVVAIRIGLILRTSLYERDPVQQPQPALFTDLPAAVQPAPRSLTGDAAHYRYRTVEATIPLLNVISAP